MKSSTRENVYTCYKIWNWTFCSFVTSSWLIRHSWQRLASKRTRSRLKPNTGSVAMLPSVSLTSSSFGRIPNIPSACSLPLSWTFKITQTLSVILHFHVIFLPYGGGTWCQSASSCPSVGHVSGGCPQSSFCKWPPKGRQPLWGRQVPWTSL